MLPVAPSPARLAFSCAAFGRGAARSQGPPARARAPARGPGAPGWAGALGPGLGSWSNRARHFELARRLFSVFQLILDAPELLQRGFQALHDLPRQDRRIGQVVGVLQALVLEPEDVQAGLVPFHQIVIAEGPEAFRLLSVVPVLRIVAFDEVLQVLQLERIGLEGEVLVGPQVVDPQLLRPWRLAGRLSVKEEHIGLDSLGVEDARGQAQQRVNVAVLQQPSPHSLACSALEEDVIRHHNRRPAVDLEQIADVLQEVELLVGCCGPEIISVIRKRFSLGLVLIIHNGDAALFYQKVDWLKPNHNVHWAWR